jgi:hypothetical protein
LAPPDGVDRQQDVAMGPHPPPISSIGWIVPTVVRGHDRDEDRLVGDRGSLAGRSTWP